MERIRQSDAGPVRVALGGSAFFRVRADCFLSVNRRGAIRSGGWFGWIGGCAHLGRALGLGLGDLAAPLVQRVRIALRHDDAGDVRGGDGASTRRARDATSVDDAGARSRALRGEHHVRCDETTRRSDERTRARAMGDGRGFVTLKRGLDARCITKRRDDR